MKLIVREYLASLRERDELDALLPDLLSQMGLDVFAKPSRGSLEYGVDVAAYGSIEGTPKAVYLFSVKSGDIDRNCWDTSGKQALRPSLNSILDSYIPCRLPPEYKDKPIKICICFGGTIKTDVRQDISGYEKTTTTELISFSEWGGDKLANYIEQYFLREDLLRDQCRRLLRKSLAMLDEPDISYKNFCQLVSLLTVSEKRNPKHTLTAIRQLYLCLWILYAWCRDADNLESAYLCNEFSLLNAWEIGKPFVGKRDKCSRAILDTIDSIQSLHIQISRCFLETKIIPHVGKLHAVSHAVHASCALDVNLKVFDILGRLALTGLWIYWLLLEEADREEVNADAVEEYTRLFDQYHAAVLQLIRNNPMLHAPYKDEQAIDIGLATVFLVLNPAKLQDLSHWLSNMVGQIYFTLKNNGAYPCNLHNYSELLEHPSSEDVDSYREEVTKGSNLYPMISFLSALHGFGEIYSTIQKIKTESLEHCNFQVWFPGEDSEEHYYNNGKNHGATFSSVSVDKDPNFFLDEIRQECSASNAFHALSAVDKIRGPIILLASRHYRRPVPFHFFIPDEDCDTAVERVGPVI